MPVASSLAVGTPGAPQTVADSTVVAVITALPTTAAAWRAYTDAMLGYSLGFPEDVEFSSGTSKNGVHTARLQFRIPGVDGYQGMVLRVEPNPQHVAIEALTADIYRRSFAGEPAPASPSSTRPVTVAALPGVQIGDGGDFLIVIPYQDKVYIIAPVHGLTTTALDPQALVLFYRVLATLELKR